MAKRWQTKDWDQLDIFAVAAIELANGVMFNHKAKPPAGLEYEIAELNKAAKLRWPENRKVGQLADLHLERRLAFMAGIRSHREEVE